MAAASAYLEKKLLNLVLRGEEYTPPSNVFLALYTGPLSKNGEGPEVTDSNYQRMSVAVEAQDQALINAWSEPEYDENFNGHYVENTSRVLFPPIDDTELTVTHYGLWDAQTGGNLLFIGEFENPKTVAYSDIVGILPYTLKFLLR